MLGPLPVQTGHHAIADRGPGTPFPPTFLFIIGFAIAWWADDQRPLTLLGDEGRRIGIGVGLAAIALGAAVFSWGMSTFARVRTGIMLQRAATELVTDGPYRWSRNPMYLGIIVMYVGAAFVLGSLWPLLFLPIILLLLVVVAIRREERYLRTTFGRAYEEYCRLVGRWI
jgi:protein-S-isoprenylcysteine O-methyltransferase Ste14